MGDLHATITLRPTRIAFLVRPTDIASIRRIMRLNACMWGGLYNPMIPVARAAPAVWKRTSQPATSMRQITTAHIRFFEPDVYVEAEPGLLEMAGLAAHREDHSLSPSVTVLEKFYTVEQHEAAQFTFGHDVWPILKETFDTERQFTLRNKRDSLIINKPTPIAEACYGVYPADAEIAYVGQGYTDVYEPEVCLDNIETWRKVFQHSAIVPFTVTNRHLDAERQWSHEPIIFVFDPKSPTDLIELWNRRIEPNFVLPVPVQWVAELGDYLATLISDYHRPISGNPHNLMSHSTVELASSIENTVVEGSISHALDACPPGSWLLRRDFHFSSTSVKGRRFSRCRAKVKAASRTESLTFQAGSGNQTKFTALDPTFQESPNMGSCKWVNVLRIQQFETYDIALTMPFNTFNPTWPRLSSFTEKVNVTREGWVFRSDFKKADQHVTLLENDQAIIEWFANRKIRAKVSEPGRIAKQMLKSFKGFWGVRLIASTEMIRFLNKLAAKSGPQAALETEWKEVLKRHNIERRFRKPTLNDYTERNVIRLGIETQCPHCITRNWYGLDEVAYTIKCIRCLEPYPFPEAHLASKNGNWKYRVIGPFAVPDFARGSYCALLTLDALREVRGLHKWTTISTALELSHQGKNYEIDFAMWHSSEFNGRGPDDPKLMWGECKSFGTFEDDDLQKLKSAGTLLPGSIIVLSTLKDSLTAGEKKRVRSFVKWASNKAEPHLVIILTAMELFSQHMIHEAWKAAGGKYERFKDFRHAHDLESLSIATRTLYL